MNADAAHSVLIPIIVGLVEVLKRLGLSSRWAPVASLVLGEGLAFLYVNPEDPRQALLSGLILGLAAMGLWSGPKAALRALRDGRG